MKSITFLVWVYASVLPTGETITLPVPNEAQVAYASRDDCLMAVHRAGDKRAMLNLPDHPTTEPRNQSIQSQSIQNQSIYAICVQGE